MAESLDNPCEECPQTIVNELSEKSITTSNTYTIRQKAWSVDTDIDLFLLGRTGNGKSATGNSILQFPAFKSGDSMNSVTNEVDLDYSELDGRVIKVLDVRGVGETRMTSAQSRALFIREMEYAIAANAKGYHAFLIVLKYGNRYTLEEVDTINFLKAIFGETFVKDHCIIVLTAGDLFFFEHSSDGLSFENWCDEQQGSFQELLQECCHRIVLFNNKSKDENEKKKQVIKLLDLVDELKGTRYTDDKFKKAESAQTKLIQESKLTQVRQYALKEERLLFQKLKSCQESLVDELEALENLLVRTETFMKNLKGIDKNTGVLQDFIDYTAAINYNISLEIKVHVDIRQWRKSFEETQKKMELKLALEKEKLTDQYLKSLANATDDIIKRLKKELDDKIKKAETILLQEKKIMEGEFFREINKRREKIKIERLKQETKY